MSDPLVLTVGTSRDFPFQAMTASGPAASVFLATDALVARLWPGDDRAPLATPSASWIDAPGAATFQVSFQDADTVGIPPGDYPLQVWASRSGRTTTLLPPGTTLKLLAAPGTATAPSSYCTFADMQAECGWIGNVANTDADQAGFAEQRALARAWLDSLIAAAMPGGPIGGGPCFDSLAAIPGGNAGSPLAGSWLQSALDGGAVLLTGPRGAAVRRATACHALAAVLRSQASPGGGADLTRYAAVFARMANALASNLTVDLDLDLDGTADAAVSLGQVRVRRG
ncbi:hypothetical protein [Aquisphaera insulae]|uniref:hypothetical protein n=1 Tax=Aquisphaera insulae TaxID=2712864 RepID=UPI0013EDD94E|nr:hypothetical protein [Aquisphaera insulae]